MSDQGWLILYCVLIIALSTSGGYFPFLGHISHGRLQLYLSLSSGVMLGASFFHVMPDAMKYAGDLFGWWMALGVVGLFLVERFIAPHSHEMDGGHHHHDHGHGHDEHGHGHHHDHGAPHDRRAAAPAFAGWTAVLGLTIHTFINGVGLASQVQVDSGLARPGFAIFLAIVLHKPADALAISTVLSRKGVARWKIMLVQFGFAAMIPIGALAFYITNKEIEATLQNQVTGAALSISAGTFLFIALSDLLPEVQFHKHDRLWLFLALLIGVAGMGGIALLEPHEHDEHAHATSEKPADHDKDKDKDKADHHH